MMLGFIVRRCAAELGHLPTPDEFAAWANEQNDNGHGYCLFGKPISPETARIMFRQPGRLVTVSKEALGGNGKKTEEAGSEPSAWRGRRGPRDPKPG